MNSIYTDIHIHTSEDPNHLNINYDTGLLVSNIEKISFGQPILISLTDHNTINKKAYVETIKHENVNLILGAELHIRKYEGANPYHCHLLINAPIEEKTIDAVNDILDELYPDKNVTRDTVDIPSIEKIANSFDSYDYMLLPHGGQSHSTFDKSLSESKNFDTTLERSLYYNHFDGFTSRSTTGVDLTQLYFKRLGINEFVNLITCSDNYKPTNYPNAKSPRAEQFMPTWINASPTFEGLRISLSEKSRLHYDKKPPDNWSEFIGKVCLINDKADIDVTLTPGLNVVIGGSSSGKTLFVDSLYRRIINNYFDCNYINFNIQEMYVENESKITPHYINQNFIISILQNDDKNISEIELISKVFPEDSETDLRIQNSLRDLNTILHQMMTNVKKIEQCKNDLVSISKPSSLMLSNSIRKNVIEYICPKDDVLDKLNVSQTKYESYNESLNSMRDLIGSHPLGKNLEVAFNQISDELVRLLQISKKSTQISCLIKEYKLIADRAQEDYSKEIYAKKRMREKMVNEVYKYHSELEEFYMAIDKLKSFHVTYSTKEVHVQEHTLKIENTFELSNIMITEAINSFLKKNYRIDSLDELHPDCLMSTNFSEKPKVKNYEDFALKIYNKISGNNKKKYVLITKNGDDFDSLSPGWRSAIILDLVLGYDQDIAPIIIDQPEDNLATRYMNHDLIDIIKKVKMEKQIILVSHNATIPMLGDAQNVVVCNNYNGKIRIRSAPLEGKSDNRSVLDLIAELTDGGKPSIKKRVKKYNLKNYQEVKDEANI